MNRVLFVCTGNTCRSPMAEAILKHKRPDLEVQSAGVFAGHGQAANPKAIEALQEKGIDFNHASQPLTKDLINWADLVLTMTEDHKVMLMSDYPSDRDKIFTLIEYVQPVHEENTNISISDPIGLSIDTYIETLNEIEKHIDRME
ncbi:low molecular weight protein arginine phosphatase [Allobacillus sp. GCM10007491]|uniref:Low molecular weight protein arginine phosphatase n=1 Tax=Allobacillus saliphilus TaxID=2912308 RepID=A0A941CUC0_9BACI|nr:low molecular weight protein arginine phosphatase [Allobacillus saliphilus]MBR7554098.1 low molecular weight protein arginine phosphatase [Allobacillus saliphilus]